MVEDTLLEDYEALHKEFLEYQTDFHNSQTAVKKAINAVDDMYIYEDLQMHHYDKIMSKLRDAEI